jgi:hypothetical protein
MSLLPPRQVCPTCGLDDEYEVFATGEGTTWIYTCGSGRKKHPETPFSWETAIPKPVVPGREGVMAELGLYEDLLSCVHSHEGWTEHGVIEHRFKLMRPKEYVQLVTQYGHTANGPARGRSASLMLAMAMSQLRQEGLLVYQTWTPTGWWKKNAKISWWAVPPEPDEDDRVSWEHFATSQGLDPGSWTTKT